jgi:hypothetical protein
MAGAKKMQKSGFSQMGLFGPLILRNGANQELVMSLRHRFWQSAAIVLADYYNNQEGLAQELRDVLGYGEVLDLRSVVSRFISGKVSYSAYFEAIPLLFARDIVADDYPHHFLDWLDCAYASYDLDCSSGKHDRARVRTLLAKADLWFGLSNKSESQAEEKSKALAERPYQRLEAAQHLMRGIAIGVEQRTIRKNPEKVKDGLEELKKAIRLFRELRPRENALSVSDKFHIALAVHMSDWLLSELNDESFRHKTLSELNTLGAIYAFAWLAELTENWIYVYNVAETYGTIRDVAVKRLLIKAIDLNPRLADFDLETKFDGVDEPLSNAPALQQVLPEIRRTRKDWLGLRVAAFKQHEKIYRQDVNKGIRAMRKTVKSAEREKQKGKMKRGVALAVALSGAATFAFLLDMAGALAKPIF